MLRRLALSGLKGRPKQSIILLTTMILAFFFVTIAMNLLSTSQINRLEQRKATYGEWTSVIISERPDELATLQSDGIEPGVVRVLGKDNSFGLVGSFDEKFQSLAHIKVLEGRMPEALDEIALTEAQVSYFKEKPAMGDKITLTIEVTQPDWLYGEQRSDFEEELLQDINVAKEYVSDHWEETGQLVRQRERDFQYNMGQYLENFREDIAWIPEIDVAEAEETYVNQTMERFDRLTAMFATTPATKEERLQAIDDITAFEDEFIIKDTPVNRVRNWFLSMDEEEIIEYAKEAQTFSGKVRTYIQEQMMPRNQSELEGSDGSTISTRYTGYNLAYSPSAFRVFSPVFEFLPFQLEGIPKERYRLDTFQTVIHREVTVTGIIENYHQAWDGPLSQYPTSFVTQETANQLIEQGVNQSKVEANQSLVTPQHYFLQLTDPLVEDGLEAERSNLFRNNLALGQTNSLNEDELSRIILIIIAIVTCFSIFQISLVQFHKRLRRLALLRAIGATFKQLRSILSFEAIYLILVALPLGALLGFGLSYALVALNNQATGDQMSLRINSNWLLLGYVLTLGSILVGVFLPMLRVKQVPLSGRVSVTSKRTIKTTRQRLGDLPLVRQTLDAINRRHARFVRQQNWIQLGLLGSILLILLGSYLLIYLAFSDYRYQTLHAGMPDFELELPYQQSRRVAREFMDVLENEPGVTSTDLFARGTEAYLYYDGIADNPVLQRFKALLPDSIRYDHFGSDDVGTYREYQIDPELRYLIDDAVVTDIYGITQGSDLEQDLLEVLPAGFDMDVFRQGIEGILLMPGYQLSNTEAGVLDQSLFDGMDRTLRNKEAFQITGSGMISYDYRRQGSLDIDEITKLLDQITVTIPTGDAMGENQILLNTVSIHEIPLAATINSLPMAGFWPLSNTTQNPILFVPQTMMEQLYPNRMHQSFNLYTLRRMGINASVRYGSTLIQVNLSDVTPEGATQLKRLGYQQGYQVSSLYLQKQALYTQGIRSALIIGLLAITLLIIAFQIQLATFRSRLEMERMRVGILQSLGVTEGDFRKAYLKEAILRVIKAVVLAHLIILVGLIAYLLITTNSANFWTELRITLWDYQWLWHGLIVFVFSIFSVLATYWPVGSILKRQPVENIRGLN